jgi:hypothetical protein
MFPNTQVQVQDPQKVALAFMEVLGQFANGQNVQTIQKATGTPQGPYVHGPGGLFGVRGLNQSVISTHTQIGGSLGEMLPIRPSNDMNPLFPYITGVLRSDEQEKNLICDDPLAPGNFKTCIQTTVFGRKEFKTRTLEINHVGQVINRGEFMDLVLENDPLINQMGGLMQNFLGLSNQTGFLAGREMVARLIEVGIAYQRWFCPTVYTGNPGNNAAGGGYKEFPGLDLLIGTTKVDALTGAACPSLRSTIMDFGYRNISSNTDPNIVRAMTTMYRILTRKAEQQGLAPLQLVIVMREPLFYELTRYWPCQYNTDGCNVSQTLSQDVNFQDAVEFRDRMRNGKFLMIDGRQVPVVLDDCIIEDNRADNGAIPVTGYASDIYFVPLSAMGGALKTLYWEYYDYSQGSMQAVTDARASNFFWSDGGVFLWGVRPPNNWCLDMISKVEPRLILRTPQLAGRLTNVTYVPLLHTDDVLPVQDYHVNGGIKTGRPGPSPYSEWNLSGPGFNQ